MNTPLTHVNRYFILILSTTIQCSYNLYEDTYRPLHLMDVEFKKEEMETFNEILLSNRYSPLDIN